MRNRYLYITLLSLLGFSAEAVAQALAQSPQLVVTIAVDQLCTEHLEAYAPLYQQNGLKRLLTEGIVFPNASYNFTPVDHSSATATLMTGATPYYHGVSGTEWMDRKTLRPRNIVSDEQQGWTPLQLLTSTLGDELKINTNGQAKVFAFATNAESAILSAGHAADGAVWPTTNGWQVAPCYTPVNQWINWYTRQYKPVGDTNSSVTELALRCVEQSGIGQDQLTDLLSVSYTLEPNEIGYQMLDRNISDLISGIHRKLPAERVLFVFTSTGNREEARDDANERFHIPTGKFYINRSANLLNMYLGATHGAGQYVETYYRNQLFLNHQLINKKNINRTTLLREAQEFLLQMAGVRNVYTSSQLMTSDSQMLQKVRNGFCVEKCGDLLIDVAPGWQLVNEETNSSTTSRIGNIPFPIIFFGTNLKPQRITTPVTADRIAPTVTRAIHIRAPNACVAEPLI